LGGQQIAIAQTTDIDRANGMVNLTTVLLHTSGEWISSDWPVCQISETSALRRMAAALTYARRYALFAMVGIAGEDDLDAPPDIANDPVAAHKAVDTGLTGLAPNPGPAPARPSQLQTGNGTNPPVREKLGAEESAAIRAQLIQEIETPPEDDLQPRAVALLKAKNRLSADDARLVEESFAARMALQAALPEALTTDEPTSAPIDATPFKPLRGRGRPRKAKTPIEETPGQLMSAKSNPHHSAPPSKKSARQTVKTSTPDLNATSVIKFDKSMLYLSEPAVIGTSFSCDLSRCSRVWCVGTPLPIPTIFALLSRER
jgi:hypothetical protein